MLLPQKSLPNKTDKIILNKFIIFPEVKWQMTSEQQMVSTKKNE